MIDMRCVFLVSIVASAGLASLALAAGELSGPRDPMPAAPLGSAITYQGRLERNGIPVNGNCNLIFKLYDASSTGTQIGTTLTLSNQTLTEGLFVGSLDFGPGAFNGQARWLDIQVQGPGDGGFTLLTPRQAVSPAPYALYSLNSTGSPWVVGADGADLTYSGGGIGVTGASSPLSGKGVFVERIADAGYLFGFDYNTFQPLNLLLNSPGGRVGVGTTAPDGKLQATSSSEAAVIGKHTGNWIGVYGESQTGTAIWGNAITTGTGILGTNNSVGAQGFLGHGNGWGVVGDNTVSVTRGILGTPTDGVVGIVHSTAHIAGRFENDAVGGTALYCNGAAKVKTLQILGGADLAERFVTSEKAEPGTVMVIDASAAGRMRISDEPYCRRVAGVVSGAESLQAGVVLGLESEAAIGSLPIALTGRVWVKCDASAAPIRPGDLLTTAAVPGHAMAAKDPARSTGAILGKAMTSLEAGTGMVLVLVSLQ
jgi:hypothetical protein